MPLYEFHCNVCGHITEELFKVIEKPATLLCEDCGHLAGPIMSVPAWQPNQYKGAPEHYDVGLGCVVENSKHRDKICKERGIVPVDINFGKHYLDDMAEADAARQDAEIAETVRYNDNLKKNDGDRQKASADTWTADDILSGVYDEV